MLRWVKRVGFGIVVLALAATAFVGVATLRTKLPGEQLTPAGIRQSSSQYLKMRDGVEIAGEEQGGGPHSRSRERRFDAGVAGAADDHIKGLGAELHGRIDLIAWE